MVNEKSSIQIHFNGENHWVCSTYDPMKKHILLFDTLYNNKTTMELDIQLALLYGTD